MAPRQRPCRIAPISRPGIVEPMRVPRGQPFAPWCKAFERIRLRHPILYDARSSRGAVLGSMNALFRQTAKNPIAPCMDPGVGIRCTESGSAAAARKHPANSKRPSASLPLRR